MLRKETTETPAAAVEIPQQAAPTLSPEAVVDQLRVLRTQIGEVAPLSAAQRKHLRNRANASPAVLQASVNVIGALQKVSMAVGQPATDVREMMDEATRWTAVEGELRAMLNGIAGANLVRRQRIVLVAAQAYTIGAQLARDPANAELVPHVEEVKRLKRFERRKKAASAPDAPAPTPAPGSTPPSGETSEPKKQ